MTAKEPRSAGYAVKDPVPDGSRLTTGYSKLVNENAVVTPKYNIQSCRKTTRRWFLAVAVVFALIPQARAQVSTDPTARTMHLIAQSMSFLQNAPTGAVTLGVVYPPDSLAGQAAAKQIEAAFGGGVKSGTLTVYPRLLTVNESFSVRGVVGLFLTDAALPAAPTIAAALAGTGVLTIAADPAAVTAGFVVMAIRVQPRIEIYVSHSAARSAGVEFSTPFRLMIQER